MCAVREGFYVGMVEKWDELYKAAPPIEFIDNNPAVWVYGFVAAGDALCLRAVQ